MRIYCGSGFSGLRGREEFAGPGSARSRLGYIISLGPAPLLWKSQLTSETCLPALHSECAALPVPLRSLIPARSTLLSLLELMKAKDLPKPAILCEAFGGSQGAYLLATSQRITARAKYFCAKLHWLHSLAHHPTKNPSGCIATSKCPSEQQGADYLAKGLPKPAFEASRKRTQGW